MQNELEKIKDKYGEDMMKFCENNFQEILVIDNYLYKLLFNNFEPSENLYNDLKDNNLLLEFKKYIYSKTNLNKNKKPYKYNLTIPSYVKAKDDKYYKYIYRNGTIYYCENDIIIDDSHVNRFTKNNDKCKIKK